MSIFLQGILAMTNVIRSSNDNLIKQSIVSSWTIITSLAVQDSSITDIVCWSQLKIRAWWASNDYSDYIDYNYYRDSNLDLDWEQFSELVT